MAGWRPRIFQRGKCLVSSIAVFRAAFHGQPSPVRPKQTQAVEDYDNRAAFMADHAGSEIDLFGKRGNDQE